jgi:hypothetical protein
MKTQTYRARRGGEPDSALALHGIGRRGKKKPAGPLPSRWQGERARVRGNAVKHFLRGNVTSG